MLASGPLLGLAPEAARVVERGLVADGVQVEHCASPVFRHLLNEEMDLVECELPDGRIFLTELVVVSQDPIPMLLNYNLAVAGVNTEAQEVVADAFSRTTTFQFVTRSLVSTLPGLSWTMHCLT